MLLYPIRIKYLFNTSSQTVNIIVFELGSPGFESRCYRLFIQRPINDRGHLSKIPCECCPVYRQEEKKLLSSYDSEKAREYWQTNDWWIPLLLSFLVKILTPRSKTHFSSCPTVCICLDKQFTKMGVKTELVTEMRAASRYGVMMQDICLLDFQV